MSDRSLILIVEDDETLGQGVAFALQKEGYHTEHASTLIAAEQVLGKKSPRLVLLDVGLPDGSGFDFCRQIRNSGRADSVPVIFLTARDEEVNIVQGLDLGGDDYITKPFRLSELLARVRAVLRRRSGNGTGDSTEESSVLPERVSGEILESGTLIFDEAAQYLYQKGARLDLSSTELRLIRCFLRHPGQVLSRDQILTQIYGGGVSYTEENTLSVYIRRLREKIEIDPGAPRLIVTVRGMGYRWNHDVVKSVKTDKAVK